MKFKVLIISLLFISNLYSQSVKKIFKQIKNNEIELAIIESEKTDSREKFDEEEKLLFLLGKCLLMSNEKSSLFKPYDSYNLYKSITITKKEDVDEFLSKYELSLNKISDLIFQGIVIEAKKLNTVSSYEAALNICKPCNYETELIDLKIDAAYIEAKNTLTLKSLNEFIINYPKSKHLIDVTDLRDSIALTKSKKDYSSLLNYTKQYPSSKYTSKVIQKLPDVLYKESVETNTVESLKQFIREYPKDSRCIIIDDKLSKIRFREISINEVNNWSKDCSLNDYQLNDYSQVGDTSGFQEGLTKVFRNGKWGFVNEDGKVDIPIKYDQVHSFENGKARVFLNKKYGFIDKFGNEITKLIYDEIYDSSEGLNQVKLNGKWGFLDKKGKEITEIKYDKISSFNEELAIVQLNNKYGYIDKLGNEIIPIKYDNVSIFNKGIAKVKLNNKWGCINKLGKIVIPIIYDNFGFDDEIGVFLSEFPNDYEVAFLNNKCGLIDRNGKVIIPFNYSTIGNTEGYSIFKVFLNYKCGLINLSGNEITPIKYDADDIRFINEGMYQIKKYEERLLIDKNGKVINNLPKYDNILNFHEGISEIKINKKYGFIDFNGKQITEPKYDGVQNFKNGVCIVELNNKYGLVNKYGKEITEIIYDYIYDFENEFTVVKLNHKSGIIDKSGNLVIPIKYDEISTFNEDGLALVKLNEKYGFIDKLGNLVIQIKYDEIGNFNKGFTLAIENCELKIIRPYNHAESKNEVEQYNNN